jgi:hypothetical protein
MDSSDLIQDEFPRQSTPPSLLYDLFQLKEWQVDPEGLSSIETFKKNISTLVLPNWLQNHIYGHLKLPHLPHALQREIQSSMIRWQVAWSPTSNLLALGRHHHIDIYDTVHSFAPSESSNPPSPGGRGAEGQWNIPVPYRVDPHLSAWNKLAWSPNGKLLLCSLGNGALHFLWMGSQVYHLGHIKPALYSTNSSEQLAQRLYFDPITFLQVQYDELPSQNAKEGASVTQYRVVYITLKGTVFLARVTVDFKETTWDVQDSFQILRGESFETSDQTVKLAALAQFDVSPWFDYVTSAIWEPAVCVLYITGKYKPSGQKLEDPEIPIVALFISESIQAHATIPLPHIRRRVENPIYALAKVSGSLVKRVYQAVWKRGAKYDMDQNLNEVIGLQLSLWKEGDMELDITEKVDTKHLLLLRSTQGHLFVLNGKLNLLEQFDKAMLQVAHGGGTLQHAAWWDGMTLKNEGCLPEKKSVSYPAIISSCSNGLVLVHAYPSFTLLSEKEEFLPKLCHVPSHKGHTFLLTSDILLDPGFVARLVAHNKLKNTRGILTKSLRSITNTLLWHFDDDDAMLSLKGKGSEGHKQKSPFTQFFMLYEWRPLSPQEMLLRYLGMDRNYELALKLAQEHGLDPDIVYQTQWGHLLQEEMVNPAEMIILQEEHIKNVLGKIKDVEWVLQACADTVPKNEAISQVLLQHGIRETDVIESDFEAFLISKSLELDARTKLMLEYRLHLLRLSDRLALYKRIHMTPFLALPSYANSQIDLSKDQRYHFLRGANLVEVAFAYAKGGDITALTVLFDCNPKLSLLRPAILEHLPSYLDPSTYATLLPRKENTGRACIQYQSISREWRIPDWSEQGEIMEIVQWKDDIDLMIMTETYKKSWSIEANLAETQILDWYADRARFIERTTGRIDLAIKLLELKGSHDSSATKQLSCTLRLFNTFVYDVLPEMSKVDDHDARWLNVSLEEFEKLPSTRVITVVINYFKLLHTEEEQYRKKIAPRRQDPITAGNRELFAVGNGIKHALKSFLVPFIRKANAHTALLDEIGILFATHSSLAYILLSHSDLWDLEESESNSDMASDMLPTSREFLDVAFSEKILDMVYALEKIAPDDVVLFGHLYSLIPDVGNNVSTNGEEKNPKPPTNSDSPSVKHRSSKVHSNYRQSQIGRRIQEFEAHITACKVFERVGLLIPPRIFKSAAVTPNPETCNEEQDDILSLQIDSMSKVFGSIFRNHLAPLSRKHDQVSSWNGNQLSLLKELIRRTSRTESSWLFKAVEDLVDLGFFKVPSETIYAIVFRHFLKVQEFTLALGLSRKLDSEAIEFNGICQQQAIVVLDDLAKKQKFKEALDWYVKLLPRFLN